MIAVLAQLLIVALTPRWKLHKEAAKTSDRPRTNRQTVGRENSRQTQDKQTDSRQRKQQTDTGQTGRQ